MRTTVRVLPPTGGAAIVETWADRGDGLPIRVSQTVVHEEIEVQPPEGRYLVVKDSPL